MARHAKLVVLFLVLLMSDFCQRGQATYSQVWGAETAQGTTQREEMSFRDDFDQAMKPEWELVRSDPTHLSTDKAPGKLTITTQHGTVHRTNRAAPLLPNLAIMKNPIAHTDGFVITTCLEGFAPTMHFQQAGIIVYQNDDHYTKWVYQFDNGRIIWNLLRETNGRSRQAQSEFDDDTKKKVWLRLTARGNHFEFASSSDGKKFQSHGELPWGTEPPPRVGLMATNGSREEAADIDACFDFFEIRALTPAEKRQPAFVERRALAGKWNFVSCQTGGKDMEVANMSGFDVSDTNVTLRDEHASSTFSYTIDHSKQPKAISLAAFTGRGTGPALGIYELSGDSLQLCIELESKTQSPDKFETKAGDHRMLLKLKRAKASGD